MLPLLPLEGNKAVNRTPLHAGRIADLRPLGAKSDRTGESEQGWEDASRKVVEEATRTLRGVTSVWIKEFQTTVENDRVKNFRVTAKVSFVMERT